MKNVLNIILPFLLLTPLATKAQYTPHPSNIEARRQFEESRFGIFIHWGLYAMLGQGEWAMTTQGIDNKEYAKLANAFYPHDFNAQEWVEAIKNSGARYITFTSRHHDGFSMWNTQQSDYNIMHT
ncbi:MAG: alpha-L-fucosidase, partial [Bacteroidaceae bacterium]|nr:alpha-L-fucosidase [Bacteroidaceae bacterium]